MGDANGVKDTVSTFSRPQSQSALSPTQLQRYVQQQLACHQPRFVSQDARQPRLSELFHSVNALCQVQEWVSFNSIKQHFEANLGIHISPDVFLAMLHALQQKQWIALQGDMVSLIPDDGFILDDGG